MNEKQRQNARKRDVDALYCAIGQFVVSFEHVCHAVQTNILFLLEREGLRNQRISQVLLAGLTADPLRALFQSLVAETQQLNEKESNIMKNILGRFQKLAEQRNDIVHSVWFIGWGNENTTDFSEAAGMKFHKNKAGAAIKSFQRKAADFVILTEEADALARLFGRLSGCFVGCFAVEKNFVVSPEGLVSVPPEARSPT